MAKREQELSPQLETLESRLLLAIVGPLTVGDVGTFTDSDGDVVSIIVTGKRGTVFLTDTLNNNGAADGQDLTNVDIVGASPDFTITFVDSDSVSPGGGTVLLGEVTTDRAIMNLLTVDGQDGVSVFDLTSFVALNAKAGLNNKGTMIVDNILGDAAGVGLLLPNLPYKSNIQVNSTVYGDVVIVGNYGGAINVGVEVLGNLSVGGNVLTTGIIGFVGGNFVGDVYIAGNYAGITTIGGDALGTWTIGGTVSGRGQLVAGSWAYVLVGQFDGKIFGAGGDVNMEVVRNVGDRASIVAGDTVYLLVGGNVGRGVQVQANNGDALVSVSGNSAGNYSAGTGGGTLSASIGGSVTAGRFNSSGEVFVSVLGNMAGSTVAAGDNFAISVGGTLTNTNVEGGQAGMLFAGGNASNLNVGADDDLTLDFGGNVSNAKFSSDDNIIGGLTFNGIAGKATNVAMFADTDIAVDPISPFLVGRGWAGGQVAAGAMVYLVINSGGASNLTVTGGADGSAVTVYITGNVTKSNFVSTLGDLYLMIEGNWSVGLASSASRNDADTTYVQVSGNVSKNTTVEALDDGAVYLTVGGSFAGIALGSSDAYVSLGSLANGVVEIQNNLVLGVSGNLDGYVKAGVLDILVGGTVGRRSIIQAVDIVDLDQDNIGFFVAGDFGGKLDAHVLITGAGDPNQILVGRNVTKTGVINLLGALGGADELVFAGHQDGQLTVGSLASDLTVVGNASRITVNDQVNTAVTIGGLLKYLRSASLFSPIDRFSGNFLDGDGNLLGMLTTGRGFKVVEPTI